MPANSSPRDILPVSLLKHCADVFAPIVARIANLSLSEGCFASGFKMMQVSPLLKKSGLDCTDPANYRPISNMSTVSKMVERLVLVRLKQHLLASVNFNPQQSAYRTGHSTEMAIIKMLDDFYAGINNKQLIILVSLDISAAFDTICHSMVLQRICDDFGVHGAAFKWIDLSMRSSTVCQDGSILSTDYIRYIRSTTGIRSWAVAFCYIRVANC